MQLLFNESIFLYPDISGLPPQLLMNGELHTHVPAASHDADNCENNLHFMPLFKKSYSIADQMIKMKTKQII